MAELRWLTCEQFAACLGEGFDVGTGDGSAVALELIEATEGLRRQFSIVFRGPPGVPLPQGTYSMTNAALGEVALFIVPISSSAAGVHYEAVFG